MPSIVYGIAAYKRNNGNLPELRLRNMFIEHVATAPDGVALLSREGLTTTKTVGVGPVKGIFCQNNVFSGNVFTVSGGILYRELASIGSITGTGTVSFAAGSASELLICAGGPLYRYNGTTLTAVTFPDNDNITTVCFHDGLYIAAAAGTDKWYWSDVGDGSTWDPLSFASAEARPDTLADIKVVSDFLFLLGTETIERWANTGDADAPYSRVEGSIIQKGVKGPGVTAAFTDTLVFVGNDGIVYQLSGELQRLSDNGIEERIAASTTVCGFGFVYTGHSFYCLRLDTGSFLFDLTTGQWCEFATYGRANWRARCACTSGSLVLFGDDTDGKVLKFSSSWTDDGVPLERLFSAVFPITGGVAVINSLLLDTNVGWTSLLAGQGSDPKVEMRSSIDAGATWSNWRQSGLGKQGKYRARARWLRCGAFDFPGGMFEIRLTDPVPFRVSNVLVNEPIGGKSRGV